MCLSIASSICEPMPLPRHSGLTKTVTNSQSIGGISKVAFQRIDLPCADEIGDIRSPFAHDEAEAAIAKRIGVEPPPFPP